MASAFLVAAFAQSDAAESGTATQQVTGNEEGAILIDWHIRMGAGDWFIDNDDAKPRIDEGRGTSAPDGVTADIPAEATEGE